MNQTTEKINFSKKSDLIFAHIEAIIVDDVYDE
ncbi:MAG: hypothetical protein ACJA0N_001482 [Pseudohongiellaceae bacterium]|jgi:hypothetical protein